MRDPEPPETETCLFSAEPIRLARLLGHLHRNHLVPTSAREGVVKE